MMNFLKKKKKQQKKHVECEKTWKYQACNN